MSGVWLEADSGTLGVPLGAVGEDRGGAPWVCGEAGRPGCTAVWRTARSTVDLDPQCQPGFLPMPKFDWTAEREKGIFLSLSQQRDTRAPLPLRCPMPKTAQRKREKNVF